MSSSSAVSELRPRWMMYSAKSFGAWPRCVSNSLQMLETRDRWFSLFSSFFSIAVISETQDRIDEQVGSYRGFLGFSFYSWVFFFGFFCLNYYFLIKVVGSYGHFPLWFCCNWADANPTSDFTYFLWVVFVKPNKFILLLYMKVWFWRKKKQFTVNGLSHILQEGFYNFLTKHIYIYRSFIYKYINYIMEHFFTIMLSYKKLRTHQKDSYTIMIYWGSWQTFFAINSQIWIQTLIMWDGWFLAFTIWFGPLYDKKTKYYMYILIL